jgi:hypothetical protein
LKAVETHRLLRMPDRGRGICGSAPWRDEAVMIGRQEGEDVVARSPVISAAGKKMVAPMLEFL